MPSELRLVKKLDLAELTGEDVQERCAVGAETAFGALVQRYRSRIMKLVCRFINDRDRAEEISQEVFLRVYRNRERYRKSGKFSTWIFTIAVNLTKNEIRSRVRHKGTFSLDAMEEDSGGQGLAFPDLKPLPDEDLNASEVRATMTMLTRIPEVEVQPGAHFDDDVYARIRSGEGLRPTPVEWIRELFVPVRLRPVFMAGAGVCAVAIAFLVTPFGQNILRPAAVAPTIVAHTQGPARGPAVQEALPGTAISATTTPAPRQAPRERTTSVL